MSTSCANTANVLERAAFGSNPDAWPLPPADTAHELWLRAVIAGGQGRYASALADLDRLRRSGGSDARASLASSTRASFFRQLGWHHVARGWDGRAAALAHTDEAGVRVLVVAVPYGRVCGRCVVLEAFDDQLDSRRGIRDKHQVPLFRVCVEET